MTEKTEGVMEGVVKESTAAEKAGSGGGQEKKGAEGGEGGEVNLFAKKLHTKAHG